MINILGNKEVSIWSQVKITQKHTNKQTNFHVCFIFFSKRRLTFSTIWPLQHSKMLYIYLLIFMQILSAYFYWNFSPVFHLPPHKKWARSIVKCGRKKSLDIYNMQFTLQTNWSNKKRFSCHQKRGVGIIL